MLRLPGHRWSIRALAYAPGGPPLLVSGGDDRTIKLWDPLTGQLRASARAHADAVLALAFSAGGSHLRLASGGRDGSLALWELPELTRHTLGPSLRQGPVVAVGIDREREGLLAALRSEQYTARSGRLLRWDPADGLGLVPWEGTVESAAFDPLGRGLAVADLHRHLLWMRAEGFATTELATLPQRVRCLAFSPDPEAWLLGVGAGRKVELWNVGRPARLASWEAHRSEVLALAFGPGGLLLTGGGDRSVRLWDTATGRQLGAWDWKVGRVHAVALSPDGMTAAAGGEKSDVVVWDVDP
jgi:WD40 repeat protein